MPALIPRTRTGHDYNVLKPGCPAFSPDSLLTSPSVTTPPLSHIPHEPDLSPHWELAELSPHWELAGPDRTPALNTKYDTGEGPVIAEPTSSPNHAEDSEASDQECTRCVASPDKIDYVNERISAVDTRLRGLSDVIAGYFNSS